MPGLGAPDRVKRRLRPRPKRPLSDCSKQFHFWWAKNSSSSQNRTEQNGTAAKSHFSRLFFFGPLSRLCNLWACASSCGLHHVAVTFSCQSHESVVRSPKAGERVKVRNRKHGVQQQPLQHRRLIAIVWANLDVVFPPSATMLSGSLWKLQRQMFGFSSLSRTRESHLQAVGHPGVQCPCLCGDTRCLFGSCCHTRSRSSCGAWLNCVLVIACPPFAKQQDHAACRRIRCRGAKQQQEGSPKV